MERTVLLASGEKRSTGRGEGDGGKEVCDSDEGREGRGGGRGGEGREGEEGRGEKEIQIAIHIIHTCIS